MARTSHQGPAQRAAPVPAHAPLVRRLAPGAALPLWVVLLLGLSLSVQTKAAHGMGGAQTGGAGDSSLSVIVFDANDAVVVKARVSLTGATGAERVVETDERGQAYFPRLAPGAYKVRVEAAGFETFSEDDLTLKVRSNSYVVRLTVVNIKEEVNVTQDPREAATDPRGTAFTTILTEAQIAQLPDDPEEFSAALREMAGPGAVIRVNGFSGGRLPPKSQIREIRFKLNPYAAENHDSGFISVDIFTRPGGDRWHGSLNVGFRDESLDARNAFAPKRAPSQYRRFGLSLDGPLWPKRASLFLSADGSLTFDSKTVVAALPEGDFNSLVAAPARTLNLSARAEHILTKYHTLRAEYQRNAVQQNTLGAGNFDLPERAFALRQVEHVLRLSDTGTISKRFVNELRFQLRFQDEEIRPASDAPAILVQNAFHRGGAQVQRRRRLREIEFAENLDFAHERHSLRAGLLLETGHYDSDDRRNAAGTFTFASLDTFRAARPITFTRREGDPAVSFSQYQFAWYVQDDFRVRTGLLLSYGLRHEAQTHVADTNNFAPRVAFAWSPLPNGKVTVRGGGGIFYNWFAADTFEHTLRVDGLRQRDVVVRNPGFPDPLAGGAETILPPSRIQTEENLRTPYVGQASLGVESQLSKKFLVRINYQHQRGVHLLRARNINAPVSGLGRPDPSAGNVTQIESSANSTLDQLNVNLSPGQTLLTRGFYWLVNYTLSKATNEADGPLSLPVNNFDLGGERGPSLTDARHRLFVLSNFRILEQLRLGVTFRANSATPYNITTGLDDNGDTVANDRPSGVGRNAARGAPQWEMSARLSWGFGFGERPAATQQGGPSVVRTRGDADTLGALSSARGINNRWRVQIYAQVFNVFNRVNLVNFTGVQTSPFFGRATAALPGRRIETGLSISF